MRELHLQSGHEEFVDNLEEGLIIHVNATQEIRLFNKAARLMFQLPEDENQTLLTTEA